MPCSFFQCTDIQCTDSHGTTVPSETTDTDIKGLIIIRNNFHHVRVYGAI